MEQMEAKINNDFSLERVYQITGLLYTVPPYWSVYILALLAILYIYGTWTHKWFEKMGVPGPKPLPLVGNIDIIVKEGFFCDKRLTKEYGRVFGLYDGIQPVLIISDAELIKEITMKHAESFLNHRTDIFNKEMDRALVVLRNDDWKTVRNIISPVFSGGKLKKMMPVMNACARECMQHMRKKAQRNEACEVKDISGYFTLDIVAQTLFGVKTDSPDAKTDEYGGNDFVTTASKAFDEFTFCNPGIIILTLFPFLTGILKQLGSGLLSSKTIQFFSKHMKTILDMRKNMEQKPIDFVQMLLDAKGDIDPDKNRSKYKRALTEEEILANSMLFFLAGYDTTSTAIAFMIYMLALHQDVQQRLHDEIKEKWSEEELSYDTVFSMNYLDQVFNETFRMYPPALRSDRLCNKDCDIGPYHIKKGQVINISIIGAHYDDDYWPEPTKFDPDRFAPENKSSIVPCSFIPFGSGPRGCIGKRLAELVAKTAVIYMIKHFRIVACEKTENPVQLRNLPILMPINGIWLKFEERQ